MNFRKLFLVFPVVLFAPLAFAGAVTVNPGDSVQSLVNANPAGTTFNFSAGTYNAQHILPKSGDVFVGALVNGVRVSILNGLASEFPAFDTSTAPSTGVTVKNFVLTNYGGNAGTTLGAIIFGGNGTNWIIENNEVTLSRLDGVDIGAGAVLNNNYIHDNAKDGVGGFESNGALVENNEVANNETDHDNPETGTASAAGMKFFEANNVTVSNNYVHDNWGMGIWFDTDCGGTVINGNTVANNSYRGIMDEISYGAQISNNIITGNGAVSQSRGFGIYISTSQNVRVYSNTLSGNQGGGVYALEENRGSGSQGVYQLANVEVTNNIIDLSAGGQNGIAQDDGDLSVITAKGNHFSNDIYFLGGNQAPFIFSKSGLSWANWQGDGQDTSGSMSLASLTSPLVPQFVTAMSKVGLAINGGATINGKALQMTNGTANQESSTYFATPLNIQAFTSNFTFRLNQAKADGFTFVIQNQGPSALGAGGGSLGYGGISKSVAIKFDIFSNAGEGNDSTGYYANGEAPTLGASLFNLTPSGVVLASGDLISAHVVYDGATLTWTITDQTISTRPTAINSVQVNIPAIVGGNSAYVGFTAASGGETAVQDILSWTFNSSLPQYSTGMIQAGLIMNGGASINGNVLQMTDGKIGQESSTYFSIPVNIQAFTSNFRFQLDQAHADGFTFVIQNDGPTALGGGGGSLGYGGIPRSTAIKFDIFNNSGEGSDSTGYYFNGETPTTGSSLFDLIASNVILASGDVMNAYIVYDGATLAWTITDETLPTHPSATNSVRVNIPSTVGGDTAYVGFTAASGGESAVQNILSWTFAN